VNAARTGVKITACAVAAGVLGVLAYAGLHRAAPAASIPDQAAAAPAALPVTAHPARAALPAAATAAVSIEDQVRVLSASATPADWMKAFQAIETCLRLERDKELVDTEVKITKHGKDDAVELVSTRAGDAALDGLRHTCAPMTGRTRLDRYQLLERAVDGHAPGALALYIMQGPQGDRDALNERPTDPLVIAWREAALRRLQDGIRQGYPDVLLTAATTYGLLGQAQEPADVYLQQLAANRITAAINHDDGIYPQTELEQWSAGLGPQQRQDAELAADRIFAAWKARQR